MLAALNRTLEKDFAVSLGVHVLFTVVSGTYYGFGVCTECMVWRLLWLVCREYTFRHHCFPFPVCV